MIAILDLDPFDSTELGKFLESITNDFKITLNEIELIQSSKIIISYTGNIKKAIRKIHLMNLFSSLRLINEKHILGINIGMHLMCEYVDNTACLAMFSDVNKKLKFCNVIDFKDNFFEITKLGDDLLFKEIPENAKFYFEKNQFLLKNLYTTSVLKTNQYLSASIRKDKFYGIQFLPQKSGEYGLKVLKNFVEL